MFTVYTAKLCVNCVCSINFTQKCDKAETIVLDGETLTSDVLLYIGYGSAHIALTDAAWDRVRSSRKVVDDGLASGTGMLASYKHGK